MSYRDSVEIAYRSIGSINGQFAEGYRLSRALALPASYRAATQILVCGMGGSALGADLVRFATAL
jgi:glucose-6-phosphate isomerase